jgi:rsbT co-antagonist protein RsbR
VTDTSNLQQQVEELTTALQNQTQESNVFRAIADNAPYGITLSGADGSPIYTNQAMYKMLGFDYDKQELVGVDLSISFSKEDYEHIVTNVVPRLISGESWQGELRYIRKDKSTFDALVTGFLLADEQGQPLHIVTLTQDISERKQVEEEHIRLQQEVIDAQKRAIQELSTPIIPVMDRIIVMPLIGSIDTMRARDITRTLLAGIRENRAKVVILDITGVPLVDSGVANYLNNTIQAARLKGARTIITGVSDAVAETITDLGIDWSGIETLADLQTGLVVALASLGLQLARI